MRFRCDFLLGLVERKKTFHWIYTRRINNKKSPQSGFSWLWIFQSFMIYAMASNVKFHNITKTMGQRLIYVCIGNASSLSRKKRAVEHAIRFHFSVLIKIHMVRVCICVSVFFFICTRKRVAWDQFIMMHIVCAVNSPKLFEIWTNAKANAIHKFHTGIFKWNLNDMN